MALAVLEVIPGSSLGPFEIGQTIGEVIRWLQREVPSVSVEIKYNKEEIMKWDIVIDVIDAGILVLIDSSTQVVRQVEIYDVDKAFISYGGRTASAALSIIDVGEVFGPTHPGLFNGDIGVYKLSYPGLLFFFPISKQHSHMFVRSEDFDESGAGFIPPTELPDGSVPLASRVVLNSSSSSSSSGAPRVRHLLPFYFEKLQVHLNRSVCFVERDVEIPFGASVQDVVTILGPPASIFCKEEDKMKIHTLPHSHSDSSGDYFYNYFSLGIDILFSICTHKVKKFVLHTNFPCHVEFNQYAKCNFHLEIGNKFITCDSKWVDVERAFDSPGIKPLLNTRSSHMDPFGPTLFYGVQHAIFEIMPNNHIATLCLLSPEV